MTGERERRLFVVLPIYNEATDLPPLLKSLRETVQGHGMTMTIVAVDDGSSDGTSQVLARHADEHGALHLITHRRNRGLGETIRDGFEAAVDLAADDDIIVRMDADNSHDPRYLTDLVACIEAGHDVAITSRFAPGGAAVGVPGHRAVISRVANVLFGLLFHVPGVKEYTCGYRAYRAGLLRRAIEVYGNNFIQLKSFGFACTLEKLVKLHLLGARVAEVPFTLRYDLKAGNSKMVLNLTTLGYGAMVVLHWWPWGGWKWRDWSAAAGQR